MPHLPKHFMSIPSPTNPRLPSRTTPKAQRLIEPNPVPTITTKMSTNPDARARLLAHFSTSDPSSHGQKWDELYKEDFLPWDKGFPSPALVDLLTSGQDKDTLPRPSQAGSTKLKLKLKALVPGCGKGYDVLLLSAFGYDAYGLDTSGTALEAARGLEREADGKGVYVTREGVEKGSVNWIQGDFFREGFGKGVDGTFDFIYDYTVGVSFVYCSAGELTFCTIVVPFCSPSIAETAVGEEV